MADRAVDKYLNDHLGGATLGTDLAAHIRDHYAGTPFGDEMKSLAAEIENDRKTLVDLMERIGVQPNPVKQAFGWVAEKVAGVKFSGVFGDPEQGAFMALESLMLGVEGKASMWRSLKQIADEYPSLATTDLDHLLERAESQKATLQSEILTAAKTTLHDDGEHKPFNAYSAENPPSRDERVPA